MQTIYEPIVPIDTFNIDKVSIKNSVFVYDDPVYTSFLTRIMLDNVELKLSKSKEKVKVVSPQLMQIQMELEKLIKNTIDITHDITTDITTDTIPEINRVEYFPYIPINFTKNTLVDLIPTKVSNKPRIQIKTKDDFIQQLVSYYGNKFNGINAKANIILKPIILKNKNLVWFEIEYAEISHSLCYNSSNIYKKIYSCEKAIMTTTIDV
jgi:hypothetical protein